MLNFIICYFALDFIRKNINTSWFYPQYPDLLKVVQMGVVPGLLIQDIIFPDRFKFVPQLGWIFVIFMIIYILYHSKENLLAGSLLKAGLPYAIVFAFIYVIKYTMPTLYKTNDDYAEIFRLTSIVWLFAFGLSARNQIKNINKEKELKEKILLENEVLEKLVQERTNEILQQKTQLETTLEELRQTQNQLIQQEKLASLGELTAGIAHEIQNPLNFVNNFSEVSTELLQELKEELAEVPEIAQEILEDLNQNLEKISYHGKRASGIVRNMLEHSRASTGERQSVNLNALAEEYLKLSFHGLRAKDKSFNSDFKLVPDESLPEIQVIPQDLGRVLLNLCNNAFYAVQKRASEKQEGYKPLVTVSVQKVNNKAKITVGDNGTGIPEDVISKIFQPFFTTKPTGQGTGLGLSLSYDIITKGHGGEITVNSKEGEGTQFIITLPLQ
jgi:two-component system NtrC family sensor kinase